jgi:hypothetical protein
MEDNEDGWKWLARYGLNRREVPTTSWPRGNQGGAIFADDLDRLVRLETRAEAWEKTGGRIHGVESLSFGGGDTAGHDNKAVPR